MFSDKEYFSHLRYDVLRHIPSKVARVLSLGCGSGNTEAQLIKAGIKVVGVELDPDAALIARGKGLEVLVGDLNRLINQLSGHCFDCLICADILEHLVNPEMVIKQYSSLLNPGGMIIVSVPNFRHFSVFNQLFIRGEIKYCDAGILDRSHLRITTSRMVISWLSSTGFKIKNKEYIIQQRRYKWLAKMLFGIADEYLASQIIITGIKQTS